MYVETVRIRKEAAHSLGKQLNTNNDIEKLEKYSNKIIDLLKNQSIIKKFEKKLEILKKIDLKDEQEKTNIKSEENNNKVIKGKKILVFSTRLLSKEEMEELEIKYQFQKENIIELDTIDIEKWKKLKSDNDFKYFKDKIKNILKEGDYILIHGDYLKMTKTVGYALTTNPSKPYKIKTLIISDTVSSKDGYFKEI